MRILGAEFDIITKNEVKDIDSRIKKTVEMNNLEGFTFDLLSHHIKCGDKEIIFDWNSTRWSVYNEGSHLKVELLYGDFDEEFTEYQGEQVRVSEDDFIKILLDPSKYKYNPEEEETVLYYENKDGSEAEVYPYEVTLFALRYVDDDEFIQSIVLFQKEEEKV